MKKASLMLSAVLAAAAIVAPLSACASRSPEDELQNYSVPLGSVLPDGTFIADKIGFSSSEKLEGYPEHFGHDDFLAINVTDRTAPDFTHKFKLYDVQKHGYVTETVYDEIALCGDTDFINCSVRRADGSFGVTVYSPSGEVVTEAYADGTHRAPELRESRSLLIDGQIKSVHVLSYFTAPATERQKYFVYHPSADRWEEISADRVTDRTDLPAYASATLYLGADESDGERTSSLDGWYLNTDCETTPAFAGANFVTGTYSFFHTNGTTNVLTLSNALPVGLCGPYFFFYEAEQTGADADGCRLQYFSEAENQILTYRVALNRYSLTSGKTDPIDAEYFYSGGTRQMYNYAQKDFDRACAEGFPFVNGVASPEDDRSAELMMNTDGEVCRVLSENIYGTDGTIVWLKENRYFANGFVFDGQCNPIRAVNNAVIYKNAELITGRDENTNRAYAVDYDGNVLLNPVYESLNFYGQTAFTSLSDGRKDVLVSRTHPEGLTVYAVTDAPGNAVISAHAGLLFVSVPTGSRYPLSLYNLDGLKIAEFPDYANAAHPVPVFYSDYAVITVKNEFYLLT